MENLTLSETSYTPAINLDVQGTISFVGPSYPENTFEFYKPVMQWLENYFKKTDNALTTVNLEIIYLNSSSTKLFFDLFDLLDEASSKLDIQINWFYDADNDSALEAGEDFMADFENLKIEMIEK
jgi:hypothetical protein